MPAFTVRTADQLPGLLRALRKQSGLTQAQIAQRLGVTQQTYSALERNAESMGASRLLSVLHILGADMVLVPTEPDATPRAAERDSPAW